MLVVFFANDQEATCAFVCCGVLVIYRVDKYALDAWVFLCKLESAAVGVFRRTKKFTEIVRQAGSNGMAAAVVEQEEMVNDGCRTGRTGDCS